MTKNKKFKDLKDLIYKTKCFLLCAIAVVCAMPMILGGCSGDEQENGNPTIVCTIFPEYDWVKQITSGVTDENGNSALNVKLLGENGVDMHNYKPTIADIATIGKCAAFVYVGGESDQWVDEAIISSENKNLVQINLFDVLSEKGMLLCEEEEEGEEHDHDHDHEGDCEYDEHVWLSIKNAQAIVDALCDKICALDSANEQKYKQNASEYNAKLAELDKAYEAAVKNATYDTLVFADRFPFAYLLNDYGIKHDAAFSGCSAESNASFETRARLAKTVDSLKLPAIMKIDGSTTDLAEAVKETTTNKNQRILELNSMQSVKKVQIEGGLTYISVCEQNLATLKIALGVVEE